MDKNVVVVDDEPLARLRLQKLLANCDGFYCGGEAENGDQALALVAQQSPDVVLLDVRMPGDSGIEVAKQLAQLNSPPAVIFCTAYGEYALEAFDSSAAAYLLKPVKKEKLIEALHRVGRLTQAQQTELQSQRGHGIRRNISIKHQGDIGLVAIEDIRYFVADQKYVSLGYSEGEVLIDESLKGLETEFPDHFIRVHRNALAGKSHIEKLARGDDGQYQLCLRGVERRLQVSRRHAAAVRELILAL
ncbi:Sensory transduction protein LytR [Sinobacterium norvegicum]|uniref:Sensory transduction protein LytR n=1 Tax=Sinobacterium norvegicum TaxID=1641715 RepID=A0ABM9AFK7_9GAMM|nr:LytTR family DNA-binding domain-containing protein [Sinobacterium norvegicum]CAH0991810.1 Sensory transduction protein LytR [Sinobacterium norvegicum]